MMGKKGLEGKKIIITGASSGIGRSIAESLGLAGGIIIALGRSNNRLKNLEKSVTQKGGRCFTYKLDISDHNKINKFCNRIKKRFKTIDWLINSAGHIVKNEKNKDVEMTFKVNFFAPYYLAQKLESILNKDGGILNISSTAGIRPNQFFLAYSASKAALNAFSTALAKSFSSKSISCFTICPGPTNTPMRTKIAKDAQVQQKPETVSNCAKKIVLGTSRYLNGDIILVKDGKEKLFSRLKS